MDVNNSYELYYYVHIKNNKSNLDLLIIRDEFKRIIEWNISKSNIQICSRETSSTINYQSHVSVPFEITMDSQNQKIIMCVVCSRCCITNFSECKSVMGSFYGHHLHQLFHSVNMDPIHRSEVIRIFKSENYTCPMLLSIHDYMCIVKQDFIKAKEIQENTNIIII